MAVISKSTQTHGADSKTFEIIDESIAMIEHESHIFLVFLMSLNDDIIEPQFFPHGSMSSNKSLLPN